MKKHNVILTCLILIGYAFTAYSCQQQVASWNYNDYIYAVNDQVVCDVTRTANATGMYTVYNVHNDKIVDLPLTVHVKLTSNTQLSTYGGSQSEMVYAMLQYKTIRHGYADGLVDITNSQWVTVRDLSKKQGTISINAPPGPYFGRNNIDPPNIQSNDTIIIRYYVTDGSWQSGSTTDLCTRGLRNYHTNGPADDRTSSWYFPNWVGKYEEDTFWCDYGYVMWNSGISPFVISVRWSGKRRPIK